jgi:hypothetical protein
MSFSKLYAYKHCCFIFLHTKHLVFTDILSLLLFFSQKKEGEHELSANIKEFCRSMIMLKSNKYTWIAIYIIIIFIEGKNRVIIYLTSRVFLMVVSSVEKRFSYGLKANTLSLSFGCKIVDRNEFFIHYFCC